MTQRRSIEQRTRGQSHGLITRLVSPGDLGHVIKPFVFLDFIHGDAPKDFGFGFHPHSGIATLTFQQDIDVEYVDTEGRQGVLKANGLEWMQAGGGAWHRGSFLGSGKVTGFQLWVALPPGLEDGPSHSDYVSPDNVPEKDGIKVLLGEYGGLSSPLKTPTSMNYIDIQLAAGNDFHYVFPAEHQVGWAFIYEGAANCNDSPSYQEMLIFSAAGDVVDFHALQDARILLGSAAKHAHPLITGYSSVHTHEASLRRGERRIAELGQRLGLSR